MLPQFLYRPAAAKFTMAVFMTAQMLGWITFAAAAESAPSPAPVPTAPPNSLPAVRRALREFDRFLDHHPLLEDELRIHPRLITAAPYLEQNPDLRDFLRANPPVTEGLTIYPRYFLNRALLRQANVPLTFSKLAPFKDAFLQEPPLEQALALHPEAIRDPAFVQTHPALRDLFAQHPALAGVFPPPATP